MVAICIKYCYDLLINLYYIPDPPFFIACNLRNSLNTPAVLLYRIYSIELEMKDTTVRADSCTWTGPDLCMDQCVPWSRTAKS